MFPETGTLRIGDELRAYSSKSDTTFTLETSIGITKDDSIELAGAGHSICSSVTTVEGIITENDVTKMFVRSTNGFNSSGTLQVGDVLVYYTGIEAPKTYAFPVYHRRIWPIIGPFDGFINSILTRRSILMKTKS